MCVSCITPVKCVIYVPYRLSKSSLGDNGYDFSRKKLFELIPCRKKPREYRKTYFIT